MLNLVSAAEILNLVHVSPDEKVPDGTAGRESGKNQTCGDIYKVRECGSIKIRALNLWYLAVVRYEI